MAEIKMQAAPASKDDIIQLKDNIIGIKEDISKVHISLKDDIYKLHVSMKDDIITMQKWGIGMFITIVVMIVGIYAAIFLKH
jgi:hypothetical protein